MSEDTVGCVVLLAAAVGGIYWAYTNYEIKARKPSNEAKSAVARPVGMRTVSSSDDGTNWIVDSDSVRGPRSARQGWVTSTAAKTAKVKGELKNLYRVNCNTTDARVIAAIFYDAKGDATWSSNAEPITSAAQYYPPNSNAGRVVDFLCSEGFDQDLPKLGAPVITVTAPPAK